MALDASFGGSCRGRQAGTGVPAFVFGTLQHMSDLRLMAVLAHPDDESLGVGGVLARYADEGVSTSLVTATLGECGRFRGHPRDTSAHPGIEAMAEIRGAELAAAARRLGVSDVSLLGYRDQALDRADPADVIQKIATHLRRVRPHVVVTFGPDGAYGHPDHIAISQFTTAAALAAAAGGSGPQGSPHEVAKLYYLAWPEAKMSAYQHALRALVTTVDGIERQARPWADWAITTTVDTRRWWRTVWDAIQCHESQIAAYGRLKALPPADHEALWGSQSFYRAFSLVNGGRAPEADLFAGLRD